MKANVNKDKCIGCGNCVALTESQVFDFNDEGLAECIMDEITEDYEDLTKDAVKQCPTEAIDLTEDYEDLTKDAVKQCPTEAIDLTEDYEDLTKDAVKQCPTEAIDLTEE